MIPIHLDMIPKSADTLAISPGMTKSRKALAAALSVAQAPAINSPVTSDSRARPTLKTIEELLFDNAVDLKVTFSQITMHLNQTWRGAIFRQVNFLLDVNNWQDDSALVDKHSFVTFLRFIIFADVTAYPSIGVSASGNLLAFWRKEAKKLSVKFLSKDKAAASVVMPGSRSTEIVTWDGHVADLGGFLVQIGVADILKKD